MNWKALLYYFITVIILQIIISRFTTFTNAQVIIGTSIFLAMTFYGYFSLKKNISIIRTVSVYEDIPQNLVISGITIPLSVRTIAWLKITFWAIFYICIFAGVNELWENYRNHHQ